MLLNPTRVSTADMTYCRDHHTIWCDMSDLGPAFRFGQVWDDAADEGLTLVSHRTDHAVVYAVHEYRTDSEGDLVAWILKPAKVPGRRDPVYPTLVIVND